MTPAITLEELLAWNHESAVFWKAHLEANPGLLELPCGIGGSANVQAFVRHIWGVRAALESARSRFAFAGQGRNAGRSAGRAL